MLKWSQRFKLNIRQRGSILVDGCYEYVKILQRTIRRRSKLKIEYHIVPLNLAKAFDTVQPRSRKSALTRKNISEYIINVILQQ